MEAPDAQHNNEWVELRHPHWIEHETTWDFIEAHYTGTALQTARLKALDLQKRGTTSQDGKVDPGQFSDHPMIWRRISTESAEQFVERVFTSRFPRVMAAIVDSFSGSIEGVESKDVRVYDDVWKAPPEDEKSELFNFWKNADGKGSNLAALIKRQAGRFTRFHRVWCLVETEQVVFPDIKDVINWRFDHGQLVDVVVKERVDARSTIKQDPAKTIEDRFIHYHVDGFDRYKVVFDSDEERRIVKIAEESGTWTFPHYATPEDAIAVNNGQEGRPDHRCVPIKFFDLDVDGFPGRDLAEGANYLFNLLSDARNILRQSNYPYWVGDVEDEAFDATLDAVKKGWNMLQGKWTNQGPSAENARMAFEVYRQETEDYFISMHQLYEASSHDEDKTATEVSTEDTRGRRSFLSTEVRSLEELENWIWFMYSQKQYPQKPDVWRGTHVKRTRDFAPINTKEWAQELTKQVFGDAGVIPVGEKGRVDAAKKIARLLGIEFDEQELENAVKAQEAAARATDERVVAETERVNIVNENERTAGGANVRAREEAIAGGE